MSTWAVIASAWTPASVRPAAWRITFSWVIASIASSIACWTDGPCAWRCQPMNGRPSNSTSEAETGHVRARAGADRDGEAAQQLVGAHRRAAGALHQRRHDRARAAGDGEAVVEHRSGLAAQLGDFGREDADPLAVMLEKGARRRVERPDLALDLLGGAGEIEPRLVLLDLGRVGRARFGLRASGRRDNVRAARRAISAAPIPASSAVSSPAVLRSTSAGSTASIGPVSRPRSICMMVIPVRLSPARIARWIGAAPRQRGSSEAWTLRQPWSGAARIGSGRISP